MGGEPVFLRRALAGLGILHLHGVHLGEEVVQAELDGPARQAAGQLEKRAGHGDQILGTVGAGSIG